MGNIKIFLVLKIPDSPSLTRTPSGSLSCFTIQLTQQPYVESHSAGHSRYLLGKVKVLLIPLW